MCRIAIMNSNAIRELGKYNLGDYFAELEKTGGGYGNGIAILKNNQVSVKKGVYLTIEEIIDTIFSSAKLPEWLLFHTRVPSVGPPTNKNCHPFYNRQLVLAMNGTLEVFDTLGHTLNMTDTELLFKIISIFRIDPLEILNEFEANFVGFIKRDKKWHPFVSIQNLYLGFKFYIQDNIILLGSSLPQSIQGVSGIFTGLVKDINLEKIKPKTYISYPYKYNRWTYKALDIERELQKLGDY